MQVSIQGLYNATHIPSIYLPPLGSNFPHNRPIDRKEIPLPHLLENECKCIYSISSCESTGGRYKVLLEPLECLLVYGNAALGCVRYDFSEAQALEYTVIQRLLLRTAMPHLLVVIVETGPVCTEFGEAVFV